jgi:hypothetical protein
MKPMDENSIGCDSPFIAGLLFSNDLNARERVKVDPLYAVELTQYSLFVLDTKNNAKINIKFLLPNAIFLDRT